MKLQMALEDVFIEIA